MDQGLIRAIRCGAAAIATQDGTGLDRTTLVRLASGVRTSITLLAGDPVVAVVHPPAPGLTPVFAALTRREREVAGLLADGMSNDQIASRLVISTGTVKDHVHRILRKTGLPSRSAVASAWHRQTGMPLPHTGVPVRMSGGPASSGPVLAM